MLVGRRKTGVERKDGTGIECVATLVCKCLGLESQTDECPAHLQRAMSLSIICDSTSSVRLLL